MSIEWHRVDRVEIDLKALTVTLKTREGFPMAQSVYNSQSETIEAANKAVNVMQKSKQGKK